MKTTCFIIILSILLCSCSALNKNIPVQIIAECLGEKIANFENLSEASSDYIDYFFGSGLQHFSEYVLLFPFAGTEYKELGIFKVKNEEDIKTACEVIDNYIKFKKENWDTRYMSDQFERIENAKLYTRGNYILYLILDEAEKEAVTKEFNSVLNKK